MIRQLGCPTFFMTSRADLHWNYLTANTFKFKKYNISEENIKNVSYFQKSEILNGNPMFVAGHFQNRLEVFFTEILMGSNLFGQIKCHAFTVEFQFFGSPHIHFFLLDIESSESK